MCIIWVILGRKVIHSQVKLISNSSDDISSNFDSEKVDQDEGFFHSKDIFTFLLRMTQILHTPKIMWVLVVLLNVLTLSIWSNLRFPLLDSQRIQRYDHNNLLTKFCSSYLLSHWPYDHYLYNIIKWMIFFSTYLRVAKIHWYSFGSYLQVKYKTNPSIFLSFVL